MASMYPSRAAQTSLKSLAPSDFGQRDERVAQFIQRLAERRAPRLVTARLAAVAAAVGAPALDAMHAAPGGVFDDLGFVLGRKPLQKTAVVGQLDGRVCFQHPQRIGQRHFAVLVVMAVGFPIRRHMDQLRLRVVFEAALEPRGKALTGVEQPLESDGSRGGAVVEKDGNREAGV
jgi:hypothetical protein